MRGLILAAGRGSRLEPLTANLPKAMVQLRGRPLIAWQVDALRSAGIDEVAIVRGYRGHSLPFEVTYFENQRWETSNMVTSLSCAEEWLTAGSTIVSYGDIVVAPEAVRKLKAAKGDLAITYDTNWSALWRRRFEDPLSDAECFRIDAAGSLVEIGGRPESIEEVQGQYMGLLKLTSRGAHQVLERYRNLSVQERDRIDMTALLSRMIGASVEIQTVPFGGWWCEVDSPRDLALAEESAQLPAPR